MVNTLKHREGLKVMTREELQKELRAKEEEIQDSFIDKLDVEINWLIHKNMKKDYKPTNYERIVFNRIRVKLENMSKWF